jgi:hypothetical protein
MYVAVLRRCLANVQHMLRLLTLSLRCFILQLCMHNMYTQDEPILGDFKSGVGRLVARCSQVPIIVPMYHIGMHTIAPEQPTGR